MKRLEEIRTRLSEIHARQVEIADEADGAFSEDQRKEFDDLEGEFALLKTEEETLVADQERVTALAKRKVPNPRKAKADSSSNVTFVKDNAVDDPKWGFETPREFFMSVLEAGQCDAANRPIEAIDDRLKILHMNTKGNGNFAAAGGDEQSTFSDPYGGFLIPRGFSPDLLSLQTENDPIAGRTTAIPMTTPTLSIPARVDKDHSTSVSGGLRVYRRAEADTSDSSRQQYEQVTLNATSLFGIAYATEEVLERSPISIVALLEAGFRDEFGSKMIDERLNGSGVGMFEGINNTPSLISVAKEVGQDADTIVYENIINMRARVWGYQNAIWTANHDSLPQLMLMNQAVGTGGQTVWQPSAREDHPDLLLGRPLFFTEAAETVGTTGDIHCANWSQYLEGTLSGLRSAESMHVRFINHERTFKFWLENDAKSWWKTALTPKNGSTLSPFVKLDARD